MSRSRILNNALPQGSELAPVLFGGDYYGYASQDKVTSLGTRIPGLW